MAQFPDEASADGEFERQEDAFRDWIRLDDSTPFSPERNRYHLYVSLACPWASRTLIVRRLLALEDVISVTVADPIRDEYGWRFYDRPGFSSDLVNGFQLLSQAYLATDPEFYGRVTVPVLWDKKLGRIVNNSEDDICRMLHDAFPRPERADAQLFPESIRKEQEALSGWIYEKVNNGVYRAGFATSQKAYELAFKSLFHTLDELDERLATKKFLLGNEHPVETDWRLFLTLIRFDPVYHGHFKCNLRRLVDYESLRRFTRELYHWPGMKELVNFDHIKRHYYYTHDDINMTRIVPAGPDLSWLD